jgi:hypothetical protein
LPLLPTNPAYRFEVRLELIDSALNPAAIGFELRFARATSADAASELRHGFSSSSQARQQVFELSQLDLQLALSRPGMPGKDVENQLRPIEYPARKCCLEIPQLGWGQVVIEEHKVCLARCDDCLDFLDLARPDQRSGIGPWPPLQQLRRNFCAGAPDKLAKFGKRLLGVKPGSVD